jgi:hypothetical protein
MAKHVWKLIKDEGLKNCGIPIVMEECKMCYLKRSGPWAEPGAHFFYYYFDFDNKEIDYNLYETLPGREPECIKLSDLWEAVERSSEELRNKYHFALKLFQDAYSGGGLDFYSRVFPEITNRRDLYRKLIQWVREAFVEQYKKESDTKQDDDRVYNYCQAVLEKHSDMVEKHYQGKTVLGFLIGKVMDLSNGSVNPNEVKTIISRLLEIK